MLALYNFSIITRIFLSYDNPHAPINQVLRTKILRRSFYLAKSLDMIRDLHTTVCNDQKINQDILCGSPISYRHGAGTARKEVG